MITRRFLLFVILFLFAFGVLVSRLIYLQFKNHNFYLEKSIQLTQKAEIKKPLRGEIYDRNNILLASTVKSYKLYFDKSMVDKIDYAKILDSLAKLLNTSSEEYLKKVNTSDNKIVYLQQDLSSEVYYKLNEKLQRAKLGCFGFEEYQTRIYTKEGLEAHLIGYVKFDSAVGLDGVEKYYDNYLRGKEGLIYYRKDATGRKRGRIQNKGNDAVDGYNVQLTIDFGIQSIVEEELVKAVEQWQAKSAVGIVMNPNTGEILALANIPTFNPARYSEYSDQERKNRSIAEVYDPGSTFKAVTLATAIELNKVNINSVMNAENGIYKVSNGKVIRDDHKYTFLTPKESFVYSSNIVMAKISRLIGEENFYKSIYNFGFGSYTGIDLPGEVRGIVRKPVKNDLAMLWVAHGYSISVTPLQLITMYASIINGGNLMKPFVVKKVFDNNNNVVLENKPTVVRKVISESTSRLMKEIMQSVITEGTGEKAKLENVSCGGKTGTAKKFIQGVGYSDKDYISSFVGFFPVENPEYLIFVKLDSPKNGYYAAEVAAPLFKKIGDRIWAERQNELNQVKAIEDIKFTGNDSKDNNKSLPDLTGKSKVSAIHTAKSFNIRIEIRGKGDIVQKQIFDPFNNKVVLFFEDYENQNNGSKNVVPNLVGLSLREATTKLKSRGIKFSVDGTGYVVDQSIAPGQYINSSQELKIKCQRDI